MQPHPPARALQAGRDYPPTYAELLAWFPDDDACLDYLDWLRWPAGFVCPRCGGTQSWRLADGRHWCAGCRHRISATAGTIFHRTRTPLTLWFAVAWFMTSSKNGAAAKTLERLLGFGSYQTIWTMLHRYRKAMVRPGRDRLSGTVEVDETYIGGTRPGKRGRGAAGKTLVLVAVEVAPSKGFGRCRLRVAPDLKAATMKAFIEDNVDPGSSLVTDGFSSYPPAIREAYRHEPRVVAKSGEAAHQILPGVHRIASLTKRWLLGTHQGGVAADHLQEYLDEFAFRFNRRRSEYRGLLFRRLLEQAVETDPVRFEDLVANPGARKSKPTPPPQNSRRSAPVTLARTDGQRARPWRDG